MKKGKIIAIASNVKVFKDDVEVECKVCGKKCYVSKDGYKRADDFICLECAKKLYTSEEIIIPEYAWEQLGIKDEELRKAIRDFLLEGFKKGGG
ncbi:MAG: hypothetical protein ACP5F8_02630 [Candidatus Aenigmatarchaeota archaeon]